MRRSRALAPAVEPGPLRLIRNDFIYSVRLSSTKCHERCGFHRNEALVFPVPRQRAIGCTKDSSKSSRSRRVVARGERVGSFRVVPAHETSSRPPQARFAVPDDSFVRGADRDAHSQGVAAPRRTRRPGSNTKGPILLPRPHPCGAQRLGSSRLGQRVTADREHG